MYAARRSILLATTLGLFVVAANGKAQDAQSDEALIRQGVAAYDAGDYAAAQEAYTAVLLRDPSNVLARYELAFTQLAMGEFEQCIANASLAASGSSPHRARAIALTGNCLAKAGRESDALKEYRRGLKEFPDDVGLNYNAGVSDARIGDSKDAKKLFKHALEVQPSHASSAFAWATLMADEGNRAPALLTLLRFLMLDHASQRAEGAAKTVVTLLGGGVEKKGSDVSISLSVDTPRDEGDFSGLEIGISMAAASMTAEEPEAKSPAQRVVEALESVVKMADEMADKKLRKTAVWKLAASRVVGLQQHGSWQPFGYRVAALAGLEGGAEWVAAHPQEVAALEAFLNPVH